MARSSSSTTPHGERKLSYQDNRISKHAIKLFAALSVASIVAISCNGVVPFRAQGVLDGRSATSPSALVFAAEFDDPKDLDLFGRCHWWDDDGCTIITNNELEWYVPSGVSTRGGMAVLTAREQTVRATNGRTYDYTSGMISTGPSVYQGRSAFSFTYGYVEVRAKIPSGKGVWPAVWLLPASGEALPELDIIEFIGDAPDAAEMHAHRSAGGRTATVGETYFGPDFSRGFHTYAIEWTADHVVWLIDGVERYRVDGAFVPNEPMYAVANLAVGGDWPGAPDSTTRFPAEFEIDYLRIWQR